MSPLQSINEHKGALWQQSSLHPRFELLSTTTSVSCQASEEPVYVHCVSSIVCALCVLPKNMLKRESNEFARVSVSDEISSFPLGDIWLQRENKCAFSKRERIGFLVKAPFNRLVAQRDITWPKYIPSFVPIWNENKDHIHYGTVPAMLATRPPGSICDALSITEIPSINV